MKLQNFFCIFCIFFLMSVNFVYRCRKMIGFIQQFNAFNDHYLIFSLHQTVSNKLSSAFNKRSMSFSARLLSSSRLYR